MREKTIDEINEKIKSNKAIVVTAEEMKKIVKENGIKYAFEKVDVVTTATFGAMCSSGVFLNFGHNDPPIKMKEIWLNDVKAYGGIAAVDAYIGATEISKIKGIYYGGAHVIEDLVSGKDIILKAEGFITDCYPTKCVKTNINIYDLNQAIMVNPRNSYQKYNAATNSSSEILWTYMGKLLPNFGNVTFCGCGEISPLVNDPDYETIGIGTRIFLAGATGYIIGSGTQHNPQNGYGTLMVKGDLKSMKKEFIKAATFKGYGPTLYIGIGVPIPILNIDIAKKTSISDEEIYTNIIDFGIKKRAKPIIAKVNYRQLKSGYVEINDKKIKASSLSSIYMARKIANILKSWILENKFYLTKPVESLSRDEKIKNLDVKQNPDVKLITYEVKNSSTEIIKLDKKNIIFDDSRCINCGYCISICPFDVFSFDDKNKIVIEQENCLLCNLCKDICPFDAIKLNIKSEY